jgi:hypothetical protein
MRWDAMNSYGWLGDVARFASPRSRGEVVSLVVLVALLGSVTALVLGYSFQQRGSMPLEDASATLLMPGKRSFSLGEEVSGRVAIVNVANSDMVLEKIEYDVAVYRIDNSSSVREVYASSRTMVLNSSLVIRPDSMVEVDLLEIWDLRGFDGGVIEAGDYLLKIEINEFNASMSDVISVK